METAEIVRRLLTRPVTPDRARKMLHLLEKPSQLQELLTMVGELPSEQLDAAGLAIVREIVRHHGGSVLVESVPGRGSKFSLALPLTDAE